MVWVQFKGGQVGVVHVGGRGVRGRVVEVVIGS